MRLREDILARTHDVSTEKFLKALFPWQGFIELRALSPGVTTRSAWFQTNQLQEVIRWGADHSMDGYDVYFGVGARRYHGGRTRTDLAYVSAVWVDLDAEKKNRSKAEAFEDAMSFFLKPSIVIDSGHGLHIYWLLRSPTQEFEVVEDINVGLAKALGGDKKVYDAPRILRLPGTWNYKDEEDPRHVTILYFDPAIRYDLTDLEIVRERIEHYDTSIPRGLNAEKHFSNDIVEKVIGECAFLRHCRDDARSLPEPDWFAMITNLVALGAIKKIHELSRPYYKDSKRRYTPEETNRKIQHAIDDAPGPHTCDYIARITDGVYCATCPWHGKVKAPAGIAYKLAAVSKKIIVKDARGIKKTETIQNLLQTDLPQRIRYTNGRFYTWDGMRWRAITDEDLASELQRIARTEGHIIPRETLNSLVDTLKTLEEIRRDFEPRRGIPVKNGFLVPQITADNRVLWKLNAPDPAHDNTYVIGTEYDANADAPRWEQFLAEVTTGEEAELLQEYVGAMLVPFYNPHLALLIWGPGRNGKSVFANTIRRLLGEENVTHLAIDELDGHRLSAIINKLAIIGHEISSTGRFIETQTFKKIVSGDPITINPKYKEPIDYRPSLKVIYTVNDLPRVADISEGFFRRLLIVRFPNIIPEDKIDPFLEETLTSELPGILNWALEGLARIIRRGGRLHIPPAVKNNVEIYKETENPIKLWIEDNLVADEKGFVASEALYDSYQQWATKRGFNPPNLANFINSLLTTLQTMGWKVKRTKRTLENDQKRGIAGISMITEIDLLD